MYIHIVASLTPLPVGFPQKLQGSGTKGVWGSGVLGVWGPVGGLRLLDVVAPAGEQSTQAGRLHEGRRPQRHQGPEGGTPDANHNI